MLSGPSGNYGAITRDRYQRVLEMAQDSEDGYYTGRPRQASGGVARIDTSLLDREDDRDAERARLVMTPGVRRGGSTATRPQADSPLNVGSSRRFERFGDTYSFDPTEAAAERGTEAATAEGSAQKTRYENLSRMPGFTPRQAAKVVYGRGDAFDENDAAAALAQYVRQPSREAAATAIERGANQFSSLFNEGFGPEGGRARPGTQQYVDMQLEKFKQEQAIRAEQDERMIRLRAEVRPAAKARTYRYVGEDKKVHVINLDTGEEISESPSNVRSTGRGGPPAGMFDEPPAGGAPARPTTPEEGAAQFISPDAKARTRIKARTDQLEGTAEGLVDAAIAKLEEQGVDDPTEAQVQEMANRIALARQQMRAGPGRTVRKP
jgi:hypothetical protein